MNLPLLLNLATFVVILIALGRVNASWSLACLLYTSDAADDLYTV